MASEKQFDPYHKWLGISAVEQPPNHYRLLGINNFESDADVIQAAADQRMAHLRTFQTGPHSALSQRLLNEIAAVRVCLLNAAKKTTYDANLSSAPMNAIPVGRPVVSTAVKSVQTSKESTVTNDQFHIPSLATLDGIPTPASLSQRPNRKKRTNPYPAIAVAVGVVALAISALAVISGNRNESTATGSQSLPSIAIQHEPSTAEANVTSAMHAGPSSTISADGPKAETDRQVPVVAAIDKPTEKARPDNGVAPIREDQLVAFKPKNDAEQAPEADTAEAPSQPEKARQSVPDKAARSSAIETIHETFKDEYELAKTSAQMAELASMLLKQAKETTTDSASQYALLQEAGKTAISAGELQLALQVCDEMARFFDVDTLALKIKTLEAANRSAKSSPQRSTVLERATQVMGDAISADHFGEARTIGGLALSIAQTIKDANAIKTLDSRLKDVDELAADYETAKEAIQTLTTTPGDAAASLKVGKFECFSKGNWSRGLPLLAASNDAKLKALAVSELEQPASAEERLKLGDGWWAIGAKENERAKKQAMLHAYESYSQVVSELSGLPKTKTERRIKQVEDEYLGWVDVLKLVDVSRDKLSGKWIRRGREIAVAPSSLAVCCIPFAPGDRYKVKVEFTQTAGKYVGFYVPLGEGSGQTSVFAIAGKRRTAEISVSAKGHVASLNTKTTDSDPAQIEVDVATAKADTKVSPANPRHLAVFGWDANIVFHEMKVCRLPGLKNNEATSANSGVPETQDRQASREISAPCVDAIPLIDPATNTIKGRWERRGDKLLTVGTEEDYYIKVANDPGSAYEIEVAFVRKTGDDTISMMLPIGSTDCQMAVSAFYGKVSGIEAIQGRGIDKNETTRRPSPVTNGQKHVLNCSVVVGGDKAVIIGRLDGNEATRYEGPISAISPPGWWWAKGQKALAIGTHLSSVEFTSIRYRQLPNKAATLKNTQPSVGTFFNVILPDGADPFVIHHSDNYYYMTVTTGGNITLWRSRSLSGLGGGERKVVWTPPPTGLSSRDVWAPELHYVKKRWYVYFAADDGRNENHRMYALENGNPDPFRGEFVQRARVFDAQTDKWAIDGTLLNVKGKLYFIWSGWEGDSNIRQDLYIAPMSDPVTINGARVEISRPQFDWEKIGSPNVNEGPELIVRNGVVYVIYSASGSWTDDYCLGMLTAKLNSNLLSPSSWHKVDQPVFRRGGGVPGPGHASFVKSPDGHEEWIVYHAARYKGAGWNRNVRIQPFSWHDNLPDFGTPANPNEPILLPTGDSPHVRYEAEKARIGGLARIARHPSASNEAKVGNIDNSDSYVEFTIAAREPVKHIIAVRFGNGTNGGPAASHTVSVNGRALDEMIYPHSGWDNWSNAFLAVDLKVGENNIRFGKGKNFAEIDCLDVFPSGG